MKIPAQTGRSIRAHTVILPGIMSILLAVILAIGGTSIPWGAEAGAAPGEILLLIDDGPLDSVVVDQLPQEARLLARSQDFSVIAAPQDTRTSGLAPNLLRRITVLGEFLPEGSYYLLIASDAREIRVEPPGRVLHRDRHTALIWTPEDVPILTAESEAALVGLHQLVLITDRTKPWPATTQKTLPEPTTTTPTPTTTSATALTQFHPAIAGMVSQVSQAEYVARWQILDDFETRYTHSYQNELAARWLHDEFILLGLDTEYFEYEQSGPRKNVVATIPGEIDPDRVVYMTAHFDSKSEDDYNHAPGADDNASGTAALLEVARVLQDYQFQHTIRFVAFNGEEQGLVGSFAYVESLAAVGADVIGCFNLDMIAYAGVDPAPSDIAIYADEFSVALAELFEDAVLTYLPGELDPVVIIEHMGASDHAAFWFYGYSAAFVIEDIVWGPDFCPWYHTSEDRIEKYPTDFPTRVTKAALAAVAQTAMPLEAADVDSGLDNRSGVRLFPASPNPTTGATTLSFELAETTPVRVSIFDAGGRQIRALDSGSRSAGKHSIAWDGRDDENRMTGSGIYWARVETAESSSGMRIVRIQ